MISLRALKNQPMVAQQRTFMGRLNTVIWATVQTLLFTTICIFAALALLVCAVLLWSVVANAGDHGLPGYSCEGTLQTDGPFYYRIHANDSYENDCLFRRNSAISRKILSKCRVGEKCGVRANLRYVEEGDRDMVRIFTFGRIDFK